MEAAAWVPSARRLQNQVSQERGTKGTSSRATSYWLCAPARKELTSLLPSYEKPARGSKVTPGQMCCGLVAKKVSVGWSQLCLQFCSKKTPTSEPLTAEEGKLTPGLVV